jgi:hypothetical protein
MLDRTEMLLDADSSTAGVDGIARLPDLTDKAPEFAVLSSGQLDPYMDRVQLQTLSL